MPKQQALRFINAKLNDLDSEIFKQAKLAPEQGFGYDPRHCADIMKFLVMMYVDHMQDKYQIDLADKKFSPEPIAAEKEPKPFIEQKDCMQAGWESWSRGNMPVMHDAANRFRVGGGFLRMHGTQEEAIFYSSNIWKQHIEQEHLFENGTGMKLLMKFFRDFVVEFDKKNPIDPLKLDRVSLENQANAMLLAFCKENIGSKYGTEFNLNLAGPLTEAETWKKTANKYEYAQFFANFSSLAETAAKVSDNQVELKGEKQVVEGKKYRGHLDLKFTPDVTMGSFIPGSVVPKIYRSHVIPSAAVDMRKKDWNYQKDLPPTVQDQMNQEATDAPLKETVRYYTNGDGFKEGRAPDLILCALGTLAFQNPVDKMKGHFEQSLRENLPHIKAIGGTASFAILGASYDQFKDLKDPTIQQLQVAPVPTIQNPQIAKDPEHKTPNYALRMAIGLGISSLILLGVGLLFIFPPVGLVALAGGAAGLMASVGIGLLAAGGLGLTGIAAKTGYEFVRARLEYRAEERSLLDGSNKPYDNAHTVTERLATPPTITVSTPSVGNDQALEKPEKKAPFYEVVKSRVGVEEAEKYNENYKKTGKYGFGLSEVNLEFVYKAITLSELEKKELQNFVDSFPEGVVKKFNFYINETGYTGIDYDALEFNLQGEAGEPTTFLGQIKAKFDEIVARRPKELPAPTTTTLAIPSVGNDKVGVNLQNSTNSNIQQE